MAVVPRPRLALSGALRKKLGGSTPRVKVVLSVTLPDVPLMVTVLFPYATVPVETNVTTV